MNYRETRETYAAFGVDTEAAIGRCASVPVSIHCWQGDDVRGFVSDAALSGGIQVTGGYPGAARGFSELTSDFDEVLKLVPGKKRLNLHAIYAVSEEPVALDRLEPKHFAPWVDYARSRGLALDFNPTFFSHPMVKDGLTLSSPDARVRAFWIRHAKRCREIGAYFGRELGSPCLVNIWIPDGYKDNPADRLSPRLRLRDSLDEIYAEEYDRRYLIDAAESKVFGIGAESCTVGSSEFYLAYAASRKIVPLLDNGHFHPTENVADKIPSLLAFFDTVALHVTRPVRWDSDHVVLFDDTVREIAAEIVRGGVEHRVRIGLDYFDASVNRVSAWVVGARSMQKALLYALLQPDEEMKTLQEAGDFTRLMQLSEETKTLPFGAVWEEYLRREGVPGAEWTKEAARYERDVTAKRGVR